MPISSISLPARKHARSPYGIGSGAFPLSLYETGLLPARKVGVDWNIRRLEPKGLAIYGNGYWGG
jgi:hypothetical protein